MPPKGTPRKRKGGKKALKKPMLMLAMPSGSDLEEDVKSSVGRGQQQQPLLQPMPTRNVLTVLKLRTRRVRHRHLLLMMTKNVGQFLATRSAMCQTP